MPLEILLHVFETLWCQEEKSPHAQKEAAAVVMADGETNVVTDNCTAGCDHHYERNVEFTSRSEIAGDQEDGFTGHWHAGILEHHAEEHRPVPVDEHVVLDELKRVVQEIHSPSTFSLTLCFSKVSKGELQLRNRFNLENDPRSHTKPLCSCD